MTLYGWPEGTTTNLAADLRQACSTVLDRFEDGVQLYIAMESPEIQAVWKAHRETVGLDLGFRYACLRQAFEQTEGSVNVYRRKRKGEW